MDPFGLCSMLQASLSVTRARQTDDARALAVKFFLKGTSKCWMHQLDKMQVLNKMQVLDEMLDTDSSAEVPPEYTGDADSPKIPTMQNPE